MPMTLGSARCGIGCSEVDVVFVEKERRRADENEVGSSASVRCAELKILRISFEVEPYSFAEMLFANFWLARFYVPVKTRELKSFGGSREG
jgi:hypothetical protein